MKVFILCSSYEDEETGELLLNEIKGVYETEEGAKRGREIKKRYEVFPMQIIEQEIEK